MEEAFRHVKPPAYPNSSAKSKGHKVIMNQTNKEEIDAFGKFLEQPT